LMEDAINAGASDFMVENGIIEITTEPLDLSAVRETLLEKGYTLLSADVEQVPSTYTSIDPTDEELGHKMIKLLEMLEDNDDVQNVWHNWENEDAFMQE